MSRWFRFYDDAVHDPKLLKLSDGTFRMWVMLLCVASKEKGNLPSTEDLGFYLRIKPTRVAALIAELVSAGLLDKDGNSYAPHNWAGRQYVSDGSAERVKRHREKRAAAGLQSQWTAPKALRQAVYDRDGHKCVYCGSGERLSLDHRTPEIRGGNHDIDNLATACLSCNGAKRDMTETEYRNAVTLLKRPQSTDYRTEQIDKIVEARAGASAFTEGSKALASALWKALGVESPLACPLNLAGADWRAIEWEQAGWTVDLIETEARRVGPGKPMTYYEKVFATAFAKRQAPLPFVEVKPAEKLTVTHGTAKNQSGGSILAAIDRELAKEKLAQDADLAAPAYPVLRVSN